MLLTDLQIAARNLTQHTKRNAFLGAAISAVTALLVLLNGLTNGMHGTMLESATTLMTGHVNVGGYYKITTSQVAPFLVDYEKVIPIVKTVPGVDYVSPRGRGYAKAVSPEGSMDLILGGIDVAREPGLRRVLVLESGNLSDLDRPNTILLFADQARRLKVTVGDDLTLSAPTGRGINNTADVRVGAIARNIGLLSSWIAFIPNSTLLELYQIKPGTTGAVHVYLKDPTTAAAVAATLRGKLADAGYKVLDADPSPYFEKLINKLNRQDWTGQRVDVSTWEDEMSFMSWILKAFGALSGLLVAILMVIVVIGIMNTLWIAIRERTREIGTMRAIGMQRRRVAWLFLLEAGLLGLLATVSGALAGGAIAAGVSALHLEVPEGVQMFLMSRTLSLSVDIGEILKDVVVVTLATTLAALFPALRASRLAPVTAMQHFG